MKQVFYFVLFFAVSVETVYSQTDSIEEIHWHYVNPRFPDSFKTLNMNVVDSGNIKIFYSLNATDINKPETYDDLQCLEIGSHLSKYFSYFIYRSDSLVADWVKKNPQVQVTPKQLETKGKFEGWSEYIYSEYFKNFSKNELTEYVRMPWDLDKYNAQYSESIPVQNWVVSDETLTVAGHLCQKATCKFRGRDYTAWFTVDIPINNGPWKFGGLPGLILKVYDKDKLYTFECVGIENHKQKYSIEINNIFQKYKKTDRQKLWKSKKEIQENYTNVLLLATGRTFFVFSSEDKAYREQSAPYNPLELE